MLEVPALLHFTQVTQELILELELELILDMLTDRILRKRAVDL